MKIEAIHIHVFEKHWNEKRLCHHYNYCVRDPENVMSEAGKLLRRYDQALPETGDIQ